ncbi:MAG: hypothetical protein KG028_01800, partial [Actinobacteria bacterium]|nr:hypothetical protein [Actinomycetota bacterium]
PSVPTSATLEGTWQGAEPAPTRARLTVSGLTGRPIRAAALWTGAVVARSPSNDAPVTSVAAALTDVAGIDAQIAARPGGLPADPNALEAARREVLEARLAADLEQPDALGEELVDRWLTRLGAGSMAELLPALDGGAVAVETLHVAFAPPTGGPPAPRPFPVSAALLVADAPVPVGALLAETDEVRRHFAGHGLQRPAAPGLERKSDITVVWLVPATAFDDTDWPGGGTGSAAARRARRIAAAGAWLADAGIALVAVNTS